jgi:phage/plasmid-associated DNA primase
MDKSIKRTIDDLDDTALAKLFTESTKEVLICINIEESLIYRYDSVKTLYVPIKIKYLRHIISETLNKLFKKQRRSNNSLMKNANKKELEKLEYYNDRINKIIPRVNNVASSKHIAEALCPLIYDEDFSNKLDTNPDVVNFKNYIVDLQTGKFRKRTCDDYFTKALNYDYSPDADENIRKRIRKIILEICNSNRDEMKTFLSFFGYCLTGRTTIQKALWSIGFKASNGKSTFIEAFDSMFHIYVQKLNSKTFNENFSNLHKQMSMLKFIRLAYIEELGLERLDIQILKDLIGGKNIGGNEVLYGTTETFKIFFKLVFTSNKNPNFGTDEGMKRRGYYYSHTNKFVTQIDYDKADDTTGLFIIDPTLSANFDTDEYKNTLFNILLPYAMEYYVEKKIYNDTKLVEDWIELCTENDKMKLFIDQYCESQKDGVITKDSFLELYQNHYNLKNITWANLLNDVRRLGYIYDPQGKQNGHRGTIEGLVYK